MPAKVSTLSALALTALLTVLLAACGGPRDQKSSSTVLDGKNTVQISGVIISQEDTGLLSPTQIAAAKARLPHQYDEREPLSLFDFNTNLNPGSNR